jgi:hypothetical protein
MPAILVCIESSTRMPISTATPAAGEEIDVRLDAGGIDQGVNLDALAVIERDPQGLAGGLDGNHPAGRF